VIIRGIGAFILLLMLAFTPMSCEQPSIRIASKKFTESVILGELATHLTKSTGHRAIHFQELGGTKLVYAALANGELDIYPEYTGTITEEIFPKKKLKGEQEIRQALAEEGIGMTGSLGFANSYAIGMKEEVAQKLGIEKISDLTRFPELKLGFSSEFMDRGDGWPSLRTHYGLPQQDVRGMDHDLAYRQLDAGTLSAIDVYTTDSKIDYYGLRVLQDDRSYFPEYDAVFLYRADLDAQVIKAIESLVQKISEPEMLAMNVSTQMLRVPETRVAADFLADKFSLELEVQDETIAGRMWKHTKEHLDLVRKSLVTAILVAVPLGILAAKQPAAGQAILAAVGIIQTIPALALLVMLLKPVNWLGLSSIGSGSATAIIALFLYSLLPIVRNTYAGLHDLSPSIRESAAALGLPPLARLWLVELPMAARTILAGIKTAAVINVGFATLGALIGAGGYGQPILTGIRLNDDNLILQGAIPAAVLALLVQGIFDLVERGFVSKGLRLKSGS
jgi:osmoprotectant transport system permease protein